jgi:N-succinyldiaminopimelate aminotransferase
MTGARERVVTLHDRPEGGGFVYDPAALEAAIGPKTRMILLNTPHNPTGKVFSRTELEHVAALCRRHDLILVSDEVYEHLVYEQDHLPPASLPGMRERTVTISSAGKTFSLTGWKIGWTCAPEPLTRALQAAHQFITFCNGTPLQPAVAAGLDAGDGYYEELLAGYRARRERLCDGLEEVGFGVRRPAGTYFALADIRPLGYDDDVAFCRMLPETVGVAAVPPTSFYVHPEAGRHLVRFAFCKSESVLDEAIRRLHALAPGCEEGAGAGAVSGPGAASGPEGGS